MDLISLGEWDKAADVYNQIAPEPLSWLELKSYFPGGHGTLLLPFASKLIGRLAAQVYMAERAIKDAA